MRPLNHPLPRPAEADAADRRREIGRAMDARGPHQGTPLSGPPRSLGQKIADSKALAPVAHVLRQHGIEPTPDALEAVVPAAAKVLRSLWALDAAVEGLGDRALSLELLNDLTDALQAVAERAAGRE